MRNALHRRPTWIALSAALAALPHLPAQDLRWRLPIRGAASYERVIESFSCVEVRPADKGVTTVLRTAAEGGESWRHTTVQPSPEWADPGFDDSAWATGHGGFGDVADEDARTPWSGTPAIWLRKQFTGPPRAPRRAVLTLRCDDSVKVFLNGKLVAEEPAWTQTYKAIELPGSTRRLFAAQNTLAVECRNTGGAQFIDLGLQFLSAKGPPVLQGDAERKARNRRHTLFPTIRRPPLLFEGALDAGGQFIEQTPAELRDLLPWVAFDLRRGLQAHPRKATLPRVLHFGDVTVSGRVPAADPEGQQTFSLQVRSAPPAAGREGARWVRTFVLPKNRHVVRGTLTIERSIDAAAGVVRGFHARFEGIAQRADESGQPTAITLEERWTLTELRENRDAAFRKAVREAIERGSKRIREDLSNLTRKHLADAPVQHPSKSANSGRLAMGLLTLVKVGTPHDDPVLRAGYDELRRREILDTYSLGNALMALEALYTAPNEREDLRSGALSQPRKRQPTAEDRQIITEWVARLFGNRDARFKPDKLIRFYYTADRKYDNSTNQYGLLGLYVSQLCGIAQPESVWRAAAEHLLQDQYHEKRAIRLHLANEKEYRQLQAADTPPPLGERVSLGGWPYIHHDNGMAANTTGSMTAAGVAGLAMCRAALLDLGVSRKDRLLSRIDAGLESGFAWLAANFDVATNPKDIQHGYLWRYYHLYALERACELCDVTLIGRRDWYYEGAMTLIAWMNAAGEMPAEEWGYRDQYGHGIERGSFAVLFLAKAALPVLTKR